MTSPHLAAPDADAIDAVSTLMRGVQDGSLTGVGLADRAAQRCAEVFSQCDGPSDPLWPTHVGICRSVLGFGGLPAAELAQWLAVARNREDPGGSTLAPPEPGSSFCEPSGANCGGSDGYGDGEPNPVAPQLDTADTTTQDDTLADIPRDVLAEAEAAAYAVIESYRAQRDDQ